MKTFQLFGSTAKRDIEIAMKLNFGSDSSDKMIYDLEIDTAGTYQEKFDSVVPTYPIKKAVTTLGIVCSGTINSIYIIIRRFVTKERDSGF